MTPLQGTGLVFLPECIEQIYIFVILNGIFQRINVEVVALINDTVGTMVAAAYESKGGGCDIGVIIGEWGRQTCLSIL